jgi:branched-chain amino acid transport system substrate-binding protein
MRITRKALALAAIAASGALVLAGCSGEDTSSTATGDPIAVASVNALSGAATFPEASAAAKAVFDEFNHDGGLNGRPIEYTALDDKGDPSAASAAARDAVESTNAVALVGSASLLDCEVNSGYYEQSGIVSVQGTGVDPFCFTTPNISPTNAGPYLDTTLTLEYGSETLGLNKICGLLEIAGSTRDAYQSAFDAWTKATGKDFAMLDDTVPYGGSDYTPYVIKAKEAGCDAIYSNGVEPDAAGVLKAAEAQGMSDMTFLFLTSAYSAQFADAATFVGKGVYVPAEFAPYTDESNEANADWRTLMQKYDVPLTSFAQGGYLAATHFLEMLKTIQGDITRDSVTAAFKAQSQGYDNAMAGTPWIFGPGDAHASNTAGWPIVIKPGSTVWENAEDDWITAASFEK